MKLLIDIGNTRLKVGWLQHDGSNFRREPEPLALPVSQFKQLGQLLAQVPDIPSAVWAVNVNGADIPKRLEAALHTHYKQTVAVHWLHSQTQALDVQNSYQPTQQLGADRWAAMLGLAWRIRQLETPPDSALLASFGTATTLDTLFVDTFPHCRYAGGLILPGAELMRHSLAGGTANLPISKGAAALYPYNTQLAINSGVAAAQSGALIYQALAIKHDTGQLPTLFVSGGAWPQLKPHLLAAVKNYLHSADLENPAKQTQVHWIANPVLDGLAAVAQAHDEHRFSDY